MSERALSLDRLEAVLLLELKTTLKRPMLWTLLGVAGFIAWGMSTGSVMLGTGTAFVGGKKAWITSEFSNAFVLSVLAASFYSFFVTISTGLSVHADHEAKIVDLLRSTPLTAREHAWGKTLAHLAAFGLVLGAHLTTIVFFNHVWPNPEAAEIQGPLDLVAYLRPAALFAVPTIVFFAGLAFFVGTRWRRPGLVFLLPIAVGFAQFSFLWNWAPTWLDPRINRLLMLLDPSGFRWLNETWLKLDRGVDFYNSAAVGLDAVAIVNRVGALAVGVLGIALAARYLERVARQPTEAARGRARRSRAERLPRGRELVLAPGGPGLLRSVVDAARADLGALVREPGLYLFAVFVLSQTLANALVARGAFQTPILLTSGQFVGLSFNTLTLMACLLMMFFLVESLERERSTRVDSMILSSPPSTFALVAGKILGISVVAAVILAGVFAGGAIAMTAQRQVTIELLPFALIWGLLLLPTFLLWSSFISAVQAAFDSRYVTYGAGMAVLGYSLYKELTDGLDWIANWLVWGGFRWSDISILEADRLALSLNRAFALSLAVFLLAVAVRLYRRQRPDTMRLLHSLRPLPVLRALRAIAPYAALPVALGTTLWFAALYGDNGEAAEREAKDYWRQNVETWRDRAQPSLTAVDLDLELEPAESAFAVEGTFTLVNANDEELDQFALTGARHFRDVEWTLAIGDGDLEPYEPEDRSRLYVFGPERSLATGETVRVGFRFHGRYPDGLTERGGEHKQFILPSGVVLTSFYPIFAPVVGFLDGIGVDDDNRTDPPIYPDDHYTQTLPSAFGNDRPFTTRIAVTVPEDFRANSVGRLESESVRDGRRTSVWVSDHPVRFFNVVAGRWQVVRGEGTEVYYHADHPYNVAEISRALEASRKHYSEWFYPYPWEVMKLSQFPALADYAQGFPSNITFSEGIGFLTRQNEKSNLVLLVTAHEAAHQWWGNLLTPGDGPGGNLLSEGMSHFATAMLFEELEGEAARREFSKRLEERYGDRRHKDAERPLVKIDGTRRGDRTVTYDKMGWVAWMLMQEIGRDNMLAGLKEFIREWQQGPDHPLLEDLLVTLRRYAPDPEAFDRFTAQWFFDVVVPEYRLHEPSTVRTERGWQTTVEVENTGTGRVPIVVAATRGEAFDDAGDFSDGYLESSQIIELAAGEIRQVRIASDFQPERLIVDPDVQVLQLNRDAAVTEL